MPEEQLKKPVVSLTELPLKEQKHGNSFEVRMGRLGPMLDLKQLGCTLHVVPPGKRAYPFHAHHAADELFYILSGPGESRYGDEILAVKAGNVLGAPAGKTAHQIVNTGSEDLRYLGISTIGSFDVVEYPDSKKFAAAAGIKDANFKTATFVHIGREREPLDYWEGEGD